MAVANLFSRGHLMDFGGASFAELDWNPPRNLAGATIDTEAARTRRAIEEAEAAAKTGDPAKAVQLLQSLPLPSGSHQRQLLLEAATEVQDWKIIANATNPPASIEELVQRVEALCRL